MSNNMIGFLLVGLAIVVKMCYCYTNIITLSTTSPSLPLPSIIMHNTFSLL